MHKFLVTCSLAISAQIFCATQTSTHWQTTSINGENLDHAITLCTLSWLRLHQPQPPQQILQYKFVGYLRVTSIKSTKQRPYKNNDLEKR